MKRKDSLLQNIFQGATDSKLAGASFSLSAILAPILALVVTVVLLLFGVKDYEGKDWYLYLNFLLPQLTFFIVLFACFSIKKASFKSCVYSQKCHPKYFLIALIMQFGLLSLSELNTWFLTLLGEIGYVDVGISLPSMDGFGFVGVLLVVGVLPALFEEIFFRGVLLSGLQAFKTVWAVLLCGALFSLYHQNPAQTIYQFCCGACFALVALRSGSVLPTILSHFANNAFILILTKYGISGFSTTTLWWLMPISAVCLLLSLAYLIFMDKSHKKERNKEEKKTFFRYAGIGIAVCALSWIMVLFSGI